MNLLSKPAIVFQALWMLLACLGAFYMLALTLGGAAWNGVNLVVWCYLALGSCGLIGIVLGLFTVGSLRTIFAQITGISGLFVTCLSLVYIYGYIRAQADEKAAMNSFENSFLGIHGPTIAWYAFAFITCSIQTFLSVVKFRQLKSLRK